MLSCVLLAVMCINRTWEELDKSVWLKDKLQSTLSTVTAKTGPDLESNPDFLMRCVLALEASFLTVLRTRDSTVTQFLSRVASHARAPGQHACAY